MERRHIYNKEQYDALITGSIINEDFFDDMTADELRPDKASKKIVDDVESNPRYEHNIIVTLKLRSILSLHPSPMTYCEKIMALLVNSRIIENASMSSCSIQEEKVGHIEEFDDISDERDFLTQYVKKHGGENANIHPQVQLSFNITYDMNQHVNYAFFATEWTRISEKMGIRVLEDPDDSGTIMFWNWKTVDKSIESYEIGFFGNIDPINLRGAYRMVTQKNDDAAISFDVEEFAKAQLNLDKILKKFVASAENDEEYPVEITVKSCGWLAEHTLLIKVNMNTKRFDVLSTNGIYHTARKHLFNQLPDYLLKNVAVGLSVTSDKDIYGANNKVPEFHLGGRIKTPTVQERMYAARLECVPLKNNDKKYKTNRFVELRYFRNDAKCYIMIPLKNGYITKDFDNLELFYPSIMPNVVPFLETSLK